MSRAWYADSGHNSCSESGIDNVKASDAEKVTKVCSGLFWRFARFCLYAMKCLCLNSALLFALCDT